MYFSCLFVIMLGSAAAPAMGQALGPQHHGQSAAATVNADLASRPAGSEPVRARGPAPEPKLDAAESSAAVTASVPHRSPTMVKSGDGHLLPNAVRIGNNRIYDPRSGRYYWTSGAGPGEVVLP